MRKLKAIVLSIMAVAASLNAYADNFVVVGKETKVFDEPNAKGYVTLNTKNQEVVLQPGMVFKTLENTSGWYIIEYSPGLRGYMSEQVKAPVNNLPKGGTYSVSNAPSQKLKTVSEGDKWIATVGEKQFLGKAFGNIIIFFDEKNTPAYSLVDMGEGPIVMSYDNKVTKFF